MDSSILPWLDSRDINLGVPQEFVLGTLVFCLYINDIREHLGLDIFHLLYADDQQVYVQVASEDLLFTS